MRIACTICGELFLSSEDMQVTPCGHVFHTTCLTHWLDRSKSCPNCRSKTTKKTLQRLYFDIKDAEEGQEDPDELQHHVDNLKFQLKLKEQESKKLADESATMKAQVVALREEYKASEERVRAKDTNILALKTQLQFVDRITTEAQKAKDEAKALRQQVKLLQSVDSLVMGTREEVTNILDSYTNNPDSLKSLATFCSILKQELSKTSDDRSKLRKEVKLMRNGMKEAVQRSRTAETDLEMLKINLQHLEQDKTSLEKENSSLRKRVNALEEAISSPSDDVRGSVLHRLLAESPAPSKLKRLYGNKFKRPSSTESDDNSELEVTPEVVRKRSSSSVQSQEDVTAETTTIDLTSPSPPPKLQKPQRSKLLSVRSPLSDISVVRGAAGRPYNRFAKKKNSPDATLESSSSMREEIGLGYDGLGGHHKVDEFPKPRVLLKKKKTNYRMVAKGALGNTTQTTTITNFFQNTFED